MAVATFAPTLKLFAGIDIFIHFIIFGYSDSVSGYSNAVPQWFLLVRLIPKVTQWIMTYQPTILHSTCPQVTVRSELDRFL